ncbi:DUF2283 domain-containing protein, partial [Thermosulfurimonas dismutans]|uniref:DUF2283 domain-containing protein n=1 Tax=Thermosulfurimonas dismutans TaxID=999894 RepID=UPI00083945AA
MKIVRSKARGTDKAMNLPKIQADYDREADVLYLNFESGKEATDSEYLEEGIIVRYANDKIIGITI